jgi:GTP pyrophosphokinase
MSYLAKCCNPLPGDDIQGYITQGKGISVHRNDCEQFENLLSQHPEREVDVEWGNALQGGYKVKIRVVANDRSGLLRDITTVLVNEKISVHAVNSLTNDKTNEAGMDIELEVNNLDSLGKILNKLTLVTGVFNASRLS